MTNERLMQLMLQVSVELADHYDGTKVHLSKSTIAKAQKVRREVRRRECALLAAELERGLREDVVTGRG